MGVEERRAARRVQILAATRALFDDRGVRDAQIEDIARAVGINRAIIYRHFSSKEELFAVTLVGYLTELEEQLTAAADDTLGPVDRLGRVIGVFFDFGLEHPAFVDCAQALLRRRGAELMDEVSLEVMVSLGTAMGGCLHHVVRILEDGAGAGVFRVDDPHLLANILYAQALGTLNLAHLQISVREDDPGQPVVDPVSYDALQEHLVRAAVAMARGAG